jgi:hypothetical protein
VNQNLLYRFECYPPLAGFCSVNGRGNSKGPSGDVLWELASAIITALERITWRLLVCWRSSLRVFRLGKSSPVENHRRDLYRNLQLQTSFRQSAESEPVAREHFSGSPKTEPNKKEDVIRATTRAHCALKVKRRDSMCWRAARSAQDCFC